MSTGKVWTMKRVVALGSLCFLGCASGGTTTTQTQADCDKIAVEIRSHGGTTGTCSSMDPATVERFGKACAALKACNDAVSGDKKRP